MIRINLLTTATKKRPPVTIPVAAIVRTLAVIAVVAGVSVAAVYLLRIWKNLPLKETFVAVQDTPAATPAAPASDAVVREGAGAGYEPSTPVQQKMVEEVVSDVSPAADKGPTSVLAKLSYGEMSRGEQINYEYSFATNVLQILTRAVPDGIGFSSFAIDSFQVVSAKGFAPNRELVTALFRNLRRENFELSMPPRSSIRPAGNQGFRFTFACEVPLGSNPAEPWLLTDHLESRRQLGSYVRTFARTASRNGVILSHGLTHVKTQKAGAWRRSVYHLTGRGSYRNFVKFVFQLHQDRVPCAFSTVNLRARSGGTVEISADVVFTTRD